MFQTKFHNYVIAISLGLSVQYEENMKDFNKRNFPISPRALEIQANAHRETFTYL